MSSKPRRKYDKNSSTADTNNSQRRNANSVLSLTQFAHSKSKGTRRAIEKYRNKKQSQYNRKAGLIRNYKKVMKSEGYDVKNKKRPREDYDDSGQDEGHQDDQQHNDEGAIEKGDEDGSTKGRRHKKRQKFDPFAKSRSKAKQHQEDKLRQQEEAKYKLIEKEKKMKERSKRSKMMSKRTRRGQPIMKDVIGSLLGKLREEAKK